MGIRCSKCGIPQKYYYGMEYTELRRNCKYHHSSFYQNSQSKQNTSIIPQLNLQNGKVRGDNCQDCKCDSGYCYHTWRWSWLC